MTLLEPIKDPFFEKRLFVSRIILAVVISILMLSVVVVRLVQLQVRDYELFAEKSQGNRVRIEAVPPTRGLIFDRRGQVLAENLPAYQLELIPEHQAGHAAFSADGRRDRNFRDPTAEIPRRRLSTATRSALSRWRAHGTCDRLRRRA
jgi:penicillin-binding protein 2